MEKETEYIFCITTGRSGSGYLADIFKHTFDCVSFHEPEPRGHGQVMCRYLRGDVEPMRALAREKVAAIKEAKKGGRVYVETSHCFIKGFGWFIPQYLPEEKIGIVILKREKARIAESLLRVGDSPLLSYGREWVITPDAKDPLVTPPKKLISPGATYQGARLMKWLFRGARFFVRKVFRREFPDPRWLINYELECLEWYVEETLARAEAFKRQYPRIKYYEARIEELNSLESVQQMLAYFGCSGKDSLADVVGKPTNLKQSKSKPIKQDACGVTGSPPAP